MSLEDQLIEISHMHPWKSATLVALDYQTITSHYGCPGNIALDYLRHKYSDEKPKHFLVWYADYEVAKKDIVAAMCQPRGSINTPPHVLQRPQPDGMSSAEYDKIHRFP